MTHGHPKWRDPRTLFANMTGVHQPADCIGDYCTVHHPSEHHMRSWPMKWRWKGIVERTCPHGIGHPDPDDAAYAELMGEAQKTLHGCDGCCKDKKEWGNANRIPGAIDDRARDREDRRVDSVVVVAGTCTCDPRARGRLRADPCGSGLPSVGRG